MLSHTVVINPVVLGQKVGNKVQHSVLKQNNLLWNRTRCALDSCAGVAQTASCFPNSYYNQLPRIQVNKTIRINTWTAIRYASSHMEVFCAGNASKSLVSPGWLKEHLGKVRVLDATWYLPHLRKDPVKEFCEEGRIPGAQYFDLDGIADTSVNLPHMLPSEQQFSAAADALQISKDDTIVIYDRQGIFSSPRAWWTWKVFGHRGQVAVLDGGLPGWLENDGELDTSTLDPHSAMMATEACQAAKPSSQPGAADTSRYKASLCKENVRSLDAILSNVVEKKEETVVDARPFPRYAGHAEEPRPGLSKGHIPGSKNIPWNTVLTNGGIYMKSGEELEGIFRSALGKDVLDFSNVVASCGSGTTACMLVLASEQLPSKQGFMSVYDGSWSEWGARPDVPVDTVQEMEQ